MTVYELIRLLIEFPADYTVYVESPDGEEDYFVDEIASSKGPKRVYIRTAE